MRKIILTVTNDLSYDQRMNRIAGTLANAGYEVLLMGRLLSTSLPLVEKNYHQKRIYCYFSKGWLFYKEYNIRLFFFLLFSRADILCAIDLDTILPVYFVSKLTGRKRVYDAHELFTEQQEIISRPFIYRVWRFIEKLTVPNFKNGYTVNQSIADEFNKRYGVKYEVIRNLPNLYLLPEINPGHLKWIIYQGAVNEGRCFETLIPAMKHVKAKLVICGEGNFYEQAKALVKENSLENKIEFRGYLSPDELRQLTPHAYCGITLFDPQGMNQYYSLSNRFFDYLMAGIPQVCVDYPEYHSVNQKWNIAYLIKETNAPTIAAALNNLRDDDVLYDSLRQNCLKARENYHWEKEEQRLIQFYNGL